MRPAYSSQVPRSQILSLLTCDKVSRDHKQIMNEPLGAISAVVGIRTFLVQIGRGVPLSPTMAAPYADLSDANATAQSRNAGSASDGQEVRDLSKVPAQEAGGRPCISSSD